MDLTVVICTHNRSKLLVSALDSINITARPDNLNVSIIVIANACSDETITRLKEYQSIHNEYTQTPLVYDEEPRKGKSIALNRAISLCKSEWISFIDDDHKLDKEYFLNVYYAINKHPKTDIFCGKIIPDWTGNEPKWVHDNSHYRITPYPIPYFDLGPIESIIDKNTAIPGGGNLIVKTEVFKDAGIFSEHLGPKGGNLLGGEDTEFVLRSLACGKKITYLPNIKQYHYVNPRHLKIFYLLQKSFQRNKSIILANSESTHSIPKYLYIKLLKYIINIFITPRISAIRFNLTKAAGVLGEIAGRMEK